MLTSWAVIVFGVATVAACCVVSKACYVDAQQPAIGEHGQSIEQPAPKSDQQAHKVQSFYVSRGW
ncbi:MAG: hypothetical protein RL745_989 [Actinomycetota bacterium]